MPPGSIAGLVGPNGAGKSTLFAVLSGLLRPNGGRVRLRGEDVTGAGRKSRARRGLARTFQQPELFMGLTVREHLVLAHRARFARQRLWRDMLDPRSLLPPATDGERTGRRPARTAGPHQVANAPVAALPLGICRLVEVGRALASDPDVLLLDEPLSGLDMRASENLLSVFRRSSIRTRTTGFAPYGRARRRHRVRPFRHVFVLDFGECIAVGTPGGIRNDPAVRAAYLGDTRQSGPAPAAAQPGRLGMTESLLTVENLDVRYGASQALFGVSLDVAPGTVLAVWAPTAPARARWPAPSRVRAAGRGPGPFRRRGHHRPAGAPHPQVGSDVHPGGSRHLPGPLGDRQPAHGRGTGKATRTRDRHRSGHRALPGVGARRTQRAGSLSGGEQQMLALARALAVPPKLIIADEMSLGLAPIVAESVFQSLEEARGGHHIVLIEQFVHRALAARTVV